MQADEQSHLYMTHIYDISHLRVNVPSMGEVNAYNSEVGKRERMRPLGKPIYIEEDNIKRNNII